MGLVANESSALCVLAYGKPECSQKQCFSFFSNKSPYPCDTYYICVTKDQYVYHVKPRVPYIIIAVFPHAHEHRDKKPI